MRMSIKSIAAAAEVSEQTVYTSFGDKPSLLASKVFEHESVVVPLEEYSENSMMC